VSPGRVTTRGFLPADGLFGVSAIAGTTYSLVATAAVPNAVADALRGGADVVSLPLTPQRVRDLIRPR
jgi:CO/xanthine dehydrogenase Mo-binding subunit